MEKKIYQRAILFNKLKDYNIIFLYNKDLYES